MKNGCNACHDLGHPRSCRRTIFLGHRVPDDTPTPALGTRSYPRSCNWQAGWAETRGKPDLTGSFTGLVGRRAYRLSAGQRVREPEQSKLPWMFDRDGSPGPGLADWPIESNRAQLGSSNEEERRAPVNQ